MTSITMQMVDPSELTVAELARTRNDVGRQIQRLQTALNGLRDASTLRSLANPASSHNDLNASAASIEALISQLSCQMRQLEAVSQEKRAEKRERVEKALERRERAVEMASTQEMERHVLNAKNAKKRVQDDLRAMEAARSHRHAEAQHQVRRKLAEHLEHIQSCAETSELRISSVAKIRAEQREIDAQQRALKQREHLSRVQENRMAKDKARETKKQHAVEQKMGSSLMARTLHEHASDAQKVLLQKTIGKSSRTPEPTKATHVSKNLDRLAARPTLPSHTELDEHAARHQSNALKHWSSVERTARDHRTRRFDRFDVGFEREHHKKEERWEKLKRDDSRQRQRMEEARQAQSAMLKELAEERDQRRFNALQRAKQPRNLDSHQEEKALCVASSICSEILGAQPALHRSPPPVRTDVFVPSQRLKPLMNQRMDPHPGPSQM